MPSYTHIARAMLLTVLLCATPLARAQSWLAYSQLMTNAPASPTGLTVLGDQIVFCAVDAEAGAELWVSNGFSFGTQRIADLAPGPESSNPRGFTEYLGYLYFTADGPFGAELYRTDGTGPGTELMADIHPAGSSRPWDFTAMDDGLYFTAEDPTYGRELWVTKFSGQTNIVADFNPGAPSGNPCRLTPYLGKILLNATGALGAEPAYYDPGLFAGGELRDINLGSAGSNPVDFKVHDGAVYFSANDGLYGYQLYATQGTPATTFRVSTRSPLGGSALPLGLTSTAFGLCYSASGIFVDFDFGRELWAHVQSPPLADDIGAPFLAVDAALNAESSFPTGLTALDGTTLLAVMQPEPGNTELFAFDGNFTSQISSFDPAPNAGGSPDGFTPYKGRLYFSATTPASGRELASADSASADVIADLIPGAGSSDPRDFLVFHNQLFFSANEPTLGRTLWRYGANAAPHVTDASLDPNPPQAFDNVELTYTYSDPESDAEGATRIQWLRNFAPQPFFDGNTILPSGTLVRGEVWQAVVFPVDTTGSEGLPFYTESILVADTPPSLNGVAITPETPDDTDNLVLEYTYADVDGDPTTSVAITWYRNDVATAFTAATIPASATDPGDDWRAEVTANNAYASAGPVAAAVVTIGVAPNEGEGPTPPVHSGDPDGNHVISLEEVLRLIQLYNAETFGCEPGTEDNYAPSDPDHDCTPHSADYLVQDWRISLSELLRILQFYSSHGYHPCPSGEDGYCPGIV